MNLFKEVADVKTADQLHLPTPEVQYHTIASKPTEHQKAMVKMLSERASKVHSGSVDPHIDNMLKITSDGRKLGLDQRIIDPLLPDEPGTKVNRCVENILNIWREGAADKLTQLVFCDISTPQAPVKKQKEGALEEDTADPVRPFTVYDDIRSKLIDAGMPPEEIAFISDVEFGKLEGDLETVKTIDAFAAFGRDTANGTDPDQPWETFNGTDEGAEGVGTVWAENGSFFYRIDQGGVTDWHNKLICGYTGNPLTLASDSYYTVEITAKADKDVSCGFFLNPLGGWDPRISEKLDITTEEQTFSFSTTDTFVTDMDFEMLFQFGSEQTAQLGAVTIEISNVTIYQMPVM